MRLHLLFLWLFLLALPPMFADTSPQEQNIPAWQQQVDKIDEQIRKLINQRNLHLARATRYQNQGDRLQFTEETLLDARYAWQQAQIHREIAARLQQEIELLQQQRQEILDKHGIKNYSPPSPS